MGGKIDALARCLLGAALFFALYVRAFGSIPAAMGLAFVSCALGRHLGNGLRERLPRAPWTRRRELRKRALACLEAWAMLPDAELRGAVENALAALYPDAAGSELVVLPRTAACPPLDCGECLALWRARRGEERLLIVCTGDADPRAQAFVRTLENPAVRLLERAQLAEGLARLPRLLPEKPVAAAPRSGVCRLRLLSLLKVPRARAARCLASGLGLLLGYALLGRGLYLAGGLGLILLAGLALRRKRLPERLF